MSKRNAALFAIIYGVVVFIYLFFIEGMIIAEQSDLTNALVSGLLAGAISFPLQRILKKD